MVSTKLCFALVVCALVLISCAEAAKAKAAHAKADTAHAKAETAHAKSSTAKSEPGPAAEWLGRIEKVAKIAGALASDKDDNGNMQWPQMDTCYGGIKWNQCE